MLSRETLKSIVDSYQTDSIGAPGTKIHSDRCEALDRFHGREYGDEVDGRSKVVSMDLSETVEWIMPSIMEVFLAGGELGQFRPNSEDDVQAAKQETDAVNHYIMKDNDGFILIHDAVQDALLLKNGYFKHFWDDSEKTKETEYKNLTPESLLKLFNDFGISSIEDFETKGDKQVAKSRDGTVVEIIEQDERLEKIVTDQGEIEFPVFDVKLRIKRKKNRVNIFATPAEEIRVHKSCRGSLQATPYVSHVTTKTRTELIQDGLPKEFVYSLTAIEDSDNVIDQSRDSNRSDTTSSEDEEQGIDRSMDDIEYIEHYVMVDYDEDGEAELRRVITVGGVIPEGDEWIEVVDSVEITGMTGIRMAHRHEGISIHDRIKDLQRIKTTLTRQMLDNIYSTNNVTAVVNARVNWDDLDVNAAGQKYRVEDREPVGDAFQIIPVQSIVDKILPAIEYVNQIKGERTGINETTTVQDPDVLKNSTKAAFLEGLNQAGQKVRMIIRMLAETGIKELFLRVHEIVLKNQDFERQIEINGSFVSVNPTEWRERTDFDVKVGLGTGTNEEKRRDLLLLSELLQPLVERGLVSDEKAYNFYADIAKTLDNFTPNRYSIDPTPSPEGEIDPEYQRVIEARNQPQPNPLAEAEQMKGQMKIQADQLKGQFEIALTQQKLQFNSVLEQQKRDFEVQMSLVKSQMESIEKDKDRESDEAIEVLKAEVDLLKQGMNKDLGEPGLGAEIEQN